MEIPGTVSRILWHFTGGPLWNDSTKKQNLKPKPLKQAYSILKAILNDKELRISKYKELLKVRLPEKSNLRDKGKEFVFESSPVCCLTDIPIRHLQFHSRRYGKCAIGFYRESAIKSDFNPVLYTLHNSEMLLSMFGGLASVFDPELIGNIDQIGYVIDDFARKGTFYREHYKQTREEVESALEGAKGAIENFTAFVKTFSHKEFHTIYCEREWRSLNAFRFKEEDIAMIVVPRKKDCYSNLISDRIVSDKIPVLAWEDLVES